MTYALPGGLQPSRRSYLLSLRGFSLRTCPGSSRAVVSRSVAQSARDHRSGGSPSRPRRAGVGPAGTARPAGAPTTMTCRLLHLRLRGRRSRAWPAGFGVIAGLRGGAESGAVVLTEGVLFAFAEARVRVDVRGVLDLVLGHGQHDQLLAVEPGTANRRDALPAPEQAELRADPRFPARRRATG